MRGILELLVRHVPAFSLAVAVVLSAALMSLGEAEQSNVRAAVQVALWPSQRAVSLVEGYSSLWGENRRLRRDLAEATLDRDALEILSAENQRLRKLLSFSEKSELDLIPAQVVRRDAGLLSGVVVIDRGRSGGVRERMTVMCAQGLVGRVSYAAGNSAEVELLTAKDFAVGARLADRDVHGVVKWHPGMRQLRMHNVPMQVDIDRGEVVVTSSLGGNFVDGIHIGRVERVNIDEDGLFNEVRLEPPTYLWSLREVFVVPRLVPSALDSILARPVGGLDESAP